MIAKVLIDLSDQLSVMRAILVQPENRGVPCQPSPLYSEANPILNRNIFRLAHSPNVARLDVVLHQYGPLLIHHLDDTGGFDLEGLVMGAILLSLLGHQANIGDISHRGHIESAILFAEINDCLIHA